MRTATVTLLLALAGCAALAYHPGDSFEHTRQLALGADPGAQLDLARMYFDPARWPPSQGRSPDLTLAAEWCTVALAGPPPEAAIAAGGPSCPEMLAVIPLQDASIGATLARERMLGSQGSGRDWR